MHRDADRAGLGEPMFGLDHRHPNHLAAGVVFVDDRPPPFDHFALDRHRAGRGGVDRALVAGEVVTRAQRGIELEEAHKVGRHPLAVGDFVAFDRLQRLLGIELLHHHHRPAQAVNDRAPADRRGMIERGGREIDHRAIGRHPHAHCRQAQQRDGGGGIGVFRGCGADAFGPPGGAARIEHQQAGALVRNRGRGLRGQCGGEILRIAPKLFGTHHQHFQPRAFLADIAEQPREIARGDQQLRLRVADDVGGLGRGKARGDRHQHRAGALRPPDQREVLNPVFQQHREGIARIDPVGAQQVRKAVRFRLHFAIGDLLARSGHDDSGVIGTARGVRDRMHRHYFSPMPHCAFSGCGLGAKLREARGPASKNSMANATDCRRFHRRAGQEKRRRDNPPPCSDTLSNVRPAYSGQFLCVPCRTLRANLLGLPRSGAVRTP